MARDGHSNELTEMYPDLVYVSVMLDSGSDMSSLVSQWASEYTLEHPVLADNDSLTSPFVVSGYPTYVLIDKEMVSNSDLILHGHTHRYRLEKIEDTIIFNPGECAGFMKGKNQIGIIDLLAFNPKIISF